MSYERLVAPTPPVQHFPQPPRRNRRAATATVVVLAGLALVIFCGAAVAAVFLGDLGRGVEVAPGRPATTATGLEVTAAPLARAEDGRGGTYTCATVSYRNAGSRTAEYSPLDWTLQNPQGTAIGFTVTPRPGLLGVGDLAPGATASGQVCFDGYAPGRNVLVQESFGLHSRRLSWVNDLR